MRALQYIYTSWKNGESSEKGYMVYSKSEGISELESDAIKDAMQYLVPKGLPFAPTEEEIRLIFPYSFAYFILPSGRGCVAQATYLGKDYSGRFGNYIIHALVFAKEDLICNPSEMFGESYIKTKMTQDELNAASPVAPLAEISIEAYGSVINEDEIFEFLYGKEDVFSKLISYMLAARTSELPFYINDTRENLVLWSAAIQKILPSKLVSQFTFNTYIGDPEKLRSQRIMSQGINFHMIGVRPDANYFNYDQEARNSRHVVMDLISGVMSKGIGTSDYSDAMASSCTLDFEDIKSFSQFIDGTLLTEIDDKLLKSYGYYKLLKHNDLEFSVENLIEIMDFGEKYCNRDDNSAIGSKLLIKAQEEDWLLDQATFVKFWCFACHYSDFMIYTLYDLLIHTIYGHVSEAAKPCTDILEMLAELKEKTPREYAGFLDDQNSADNVNQLLLYLNGHTNRHTNGFYIFYLLDSYDFSKGLLDRQPISNVLKCLLKNICKIPDSEGVMVEILMRVSESDVLFESVLSLLMDVIGSDRDIMDRLSKAFIKTNKKDSKIFLNCSKIIFKLPKAMPLTIRLYAQRIENSPKADHEFWTLYRQIHNDNYRDGKVSVGPMVKAGLKGVANKSRLNLVFDMLDKLDEVVLADNEVRSIIMTNLEGISLSTLMTSDLLLLKKIYSLGQKLADTKNSKLEALIVALTIKDHNKLNPVSLSTYLNKISFSLDPFDQADYEAYVNMFFDDYLLTVQSQEDMMLFFNLFYHKDYFTFFVNQYGSVLKKLYKREDLARWTCTYLINARDDDKIKKVMVKSVSKVLRTYDNDDLVKIKQLIGNDVPLLKSENFFQNLTRKEGIVGKIEGLFRRK